MNDSRSTEEEGPIADDENTSDRDGRGDVHELDDHLAHLNDLDMTWGFDPDTFLQERRQQAPAAGDAGNGKAETIGSSQGGAVDAFLAPAGRAKSETIGSSQGGAVDAFSFLSERAKSDLSAASTAGTDQGNGEDSPAILSGRAAHELNDRGRLPVIVRGRTRVQSQRLEGGQPLEQQQIMNPEVADALLVAAYEWAKSGSILKSTSWTTQDAMAMMAGRPVENKRELNACMTSGFQIYVSIYCTECRYHLRQINIGNQPPPQSAADATGPGV